MAFRSLKVNPWGGAKNNCAKDDKLITLAGHSFVPAQNFILWVYGLHVENVFVLSMLHIDT